MQTWRFIVLVVLAQPLASGVHLLAEEQRGSSEQASEIAQQIGALSGNRYKAREEASQRLFEIGLPAFDALLETANGNLPEAADRAVWILQRAANAKEGEAQLPALERLVQLRDRPEIVSESRRAIAELKRPLAIARLLGSGAKILGPGMDELFNQMLQKRVRIDRDWKGGDEGLKDLAYVDGAQMVHITSAPVSAEGIALLKTMPRLSALLIHGVPLSDADLQMLARELPQTSIDYKRGALLGITGELNVAVAVVKTVRPKTVASKADFRPGDVIVRMNDKPVASFKSLTDMIAKLAPGARATFEVRRGNKTLNKEVTLGSW